MEPAYGIHCGTRTWSLLEGRWKTTVERPLRAVDISLLVSVFAAEKKWSGLPRFPGSTCTVVSGRGKDCGRRARFQKIQRDERAVPYLLSWMNPHESCSPPIRLR